MVDHKGVPMVQATRHPDHREARNQIISRQVVVVLEPCIIMEVGRPTPIPQISAKASRLQQADVILTIKLHQDSKPKASKISDSHRIRSRIWAISRHRITASEVKGMVV